MALDNEPPIQEGISGVLPMVWTRWFYRIYDILSGDEPIKVMNTTVSSVPAASEHISSIVYISDESGGSVLAFSDGANWRRSTDRAIIS